MASSIPAAVDYLVAHVRALPPPWTPSPDRPAAIVSDGWPTTRSNTEIIIGIDADDGDTDVTASYAELSRDEYESVTLPCEVAVRRSGQAAASRARFDACELFDAIRALVASDRRFGGAIRPGMPARISEQTMSQTTTAEQAGEGRVCSIQFAVTWQHRG